MRKPHQLVIIVAVAVFICSIAAWALLTSEPRSVFPPTATSGAVSAPEGASVQPVEGERVHLGQAQFANEQPAPTVAAATNAGEVPTALQPESLKLAIESTLVGQMDPGSFLDTALALSALEVRKNPIPEADDSGAIRYPLLGTPEGVRAELWVARSNNPAHGSTVLSYHVEVSTPDGSVMEGAARGGLQAQMTVWTDRQGNFRSFAVVTDSEVSGKSRALGLDMENRKIPTGMHFSTSAERPLEWKLKNCSLDNAQPRADVDPTGIIHGQWPRTDDLHHLTDGLKKMHGTLQ